MTPASDSPQLKTTPLIGLHRELGGRLVDFAGWELPIQYEGVIAEHTWCRSSAGLFDVSHMGVVELRGDDPGRSFENVTPAAIKSLAPNRMRYGLITNDSGGVIDDLMATNRGDHLMTVVNAARRDVDLAHLCTALPELDLTERDDVALLALQGPKAVDALARLAPAVVELFFLQVADIELEGAAVIVSRSGYTGEDGFELVVPADAADSIARRLLEQPEVQACGLGARDTLRLEAGLCLYGNDLDETINPVEADLVWTMPKRRREAKDFPGADRIMHDYENGATRRRVGLAAEGRRPVRDHTELRTRDGEPAGIVTSGGYGPTVERPVAMGYVVTDHAHIGTNLVADVRGTDVPVTVVELPFAPHGYRRPQRAA
ncbi:MAG: aminomethyltransferase [Acidimicrobiales bacterium]